MARPIHALSGALLLAGIIARSTAAAPDSERQYLSGRGKDDAVPWKFLCTTGALSGFWTNLPVPSHWELHGFGHLNYRQDSTNAWLERGQYEHEFTVPASWAGQRVFLVFEGAMTDTSAKLNGQSVGPTHQGGFYRFQYEVTPLVKPGAANKLEVEVAKHSANESVNRAERRADYWVFGGIYRPVYLEAVPMQFIERVAIDARHDGALTVEAWADGVKDADAVEVQIVEVDGKPVGDPFRASIPSGAARQKVELRARIASPRAWTAETPNLYSAEVRLKRGPEIRHRIRQRFGFRTMEVRDGEGLFVNGQRIILKGVNRHSFWPDSGRCLSEKVHRLDIETIKAMNGNAVRMSHYPPDAEFLDLCDELGLYVLDELAGWQNHYDTDIGKRLVEAMVTRDVNHPSILFWNNGNEGGFNTNLDVVFFQFDLQQRRTLRPWSPFNGLGTAHYLGYDDAQRASTGIAARNQGGQGVFETNNPVRYLYLPTEFLHGLYDGGAGAGLEDYWRMMMSSPLAAGGFLWAFADESLKRPNTGQMDTAGNQAPDGIVGPYREREGSFHAIQEIWSPIVVAPDAKGTLLVENRYSFIDANQCRFTWQLRQFPAPAAMKAGFTTIAEGAAEVPSIPPGGSGPLIFTLPTNWTSADVLALRATDPAGRELWTWSWPMAAARRLTRITEHGAAPQAITATETEHTLELKCGDLAVTISKDTGLLYKVARGAQIVSLATGPRPATGAAAPTKFEHQPETNGYAVNFAFAGDLTSLQWRMQSNGWVRCAYRFAASGPQDYFGVLFNYPEPQVKRKRWLGDGPYRVWKNRLRGGTLNVWENDYNDTITGLRGWVYPEFKGCFANVRWLQLETTEGLITVIPENIPYVQVLTPAQPPDELALMAKAALPQCGLGFLHGIPPMGNKFKAASQGGPQGQPNTPAGEFSGALNFYFGTLPPNP